ncbi:MAG: SusC/RagA family TonB-linked outer membrane protein [Ferruginibacter sp.]
MRYAFACIVLSLACWLLTPGTAFAQTRTVTGTVSSVNDNKTLQGSTVSVKGKNKTVVTDANGRFKIEAADNDVLVISFTGFDIMEIPVDKQTDINVQLSGMSAGLEEVVVIGYGTQKKSSVTGAVGKISSKGLNQIPVTRADLALQGKIAGVQIQTIDASAGADPRIQIRGAASINAGSSPLIVIDGYPVPTDLSSVDMNEVQSIEVLKDAASAAIYGSRGANGVILITTKSGSAGKTKISFNAYAGVSNVYKKIDFYTLDEWAAKVSAENNGVLSNQILTAKRFAVNTDPQDVIFRTGLSQNYQVSARGGNANGTKFFVAASAQKTKGVMITNNYDRFSIRANLDFKISSKFEAGINFNPSYAIRTVMPIKMHDALRTIPTFLPLYHNDTTSKYTGKPVGSIVHQRDFDPSRNTVYAAFGLPSLSASSDNNGLAQINGETRKFYELRMISGAYLKFNISNSLSFKSSVGGFVGLREGEIFRKSTAKRDRILDGAAASIATTFGQNTKSNTYDLLNENILTYKKKVGKSDFDALTGFTAQTTLYKNSDIQAGNFLTDEISTLNAGTITIANTTKEKNNLESFLFRINYAFNDKYLLSVSSRWDGSSRFGANKKWGYFPSFSAGWNISKEKFLQNSQLINDFKIRGSFGATGNNNIGNYRSFASAVPVAAILGNNITSGFDVNSYANTDLTWERTFSSNIGFDAGFYKKRVTLTMDYYNATTDKLLLFLPIPSITGYDGYWTNKGKVSNHGLEYELNVKAIDKKDFKWNVTTVGTTLKNKLVNFGGSEKLISVGDTKRPNYFLAQVGSPLVQFYGFQIDSAVSIRGSNYFPIGVQAERVFAKDQNKDGIIDDKDRVPLGTPYPKFIWGLTNEFTYKNFDVSFVLQGSHGAKIFNIDPNYLETQFSSTGANAYLAYSTTLRATTKFKSESSYNVQDASFIALRNLNIGYTFSKSVLKKMSITNLRIYCTTNNLWYKMAKNYTSYNPEGDTNEFGSDPLRFGYQRGAAPVARTIAFGINADF